MSVIQINSTETNQSKVNKKSDQSNFYKSWLIFCTVGELFGLSVAVIVFILSTQLLSVEHLGFFSKIEQISLVTLGGGIEGLLLGFFQWKALKTKFTKVPAKEWIWATVKVGMLGWFIGMMFSLWGGSMSNSENLVISEKIYFISSIGLGLFLGMVFGYFQWRVLKKYAKNSFLWIPANMIGWAIAMLVIFFFASIPNPDTSAVAIIILAILAGSSAGFFVGLSTAFFLDKFIKPN